MDMRLMLYIKTWKQNDKNKTKDSPMFTIQDSLPYLFDLFCQTSSPFCSSIYRKQTQHRELEESGLRNK